MAAVPEPPLPFDVRALAPYAARNNTEVSLVVGKVYRVTLTDGKGLWWQTRTEDGTGVGWFPASYTQVVPSAPAVPAPVATQPPPPVVQQTAPAPQPTPTVQQTQASSPVVAQQVVNDTGRPTASRAQTETLEKKAVAPPCSVTVHVIKAKDISGGSKVNPTAFLYKRDVMDINNKNSKALLLSAEKKKTNSPDWNEEFKLYVRDPESEIIGVRIGNGKSGWKKPIGDVEFPLRGAVRKFDKPNGKLDWFDIKGGKDGKEKVGELYLFIEFEDTRATEGPTNVKHEGHVGIGAGGGFEIRDIPPEWKQLFRVLNIKKKDLENNPEMAKEAFDIMSKAQAEGAFSPAGVESSEPPIQNNQPVSISSAPAPPPPPQPSASAPPPPPPPAMSGPKPPPPPAMSGPKPPPAPSAPSAPSPVSVESSAPSPPPPPASSGGGGGLSLFDQIKQGGVKLKTAEIKEVEKGNASTGNPLADTLLNAMSKYRQDIAGNDNDEGDGWSD